MQATSVRDKVVQAHWPKFGYAFGAAAFGFILAKIDDTPYFEAHRILSAGLAITSTLCPLLSAAVDYVGWQALSLSQKGIFIFSLIIGQITIIHSIGMVSSAVQWGILSSCLLAIGFVINGKQKKEK